MWTHDTRAVMVIADGKCKFIGETKWDKSDDVQEPLPEEIRLLLCLLEGAERKRNLLRHWSSQAPVPTTGDMSLVG
jgi:hypothetical protein